MFYTHTHTHTHTIFHYTTFSLSIHPIYSDFVDLGSDLGIFIFSRIPGEISMDHTWGKCVSGGSKGMETT